jgi:hypothetical protein
MAHYSGFNSKLAYTILGLRIDLVERNTAGPPYSDRPRRVTISGHKSGHPRTRVQQPFTLRGWQWNARYATGQADRPILLGRTTIEVSQ